MSLARTLGVWLLILPLMVANGIFRETALVPSLGRRPADVASAAIGIAIILLVTMPFLRRTRDRSPGALARVSAIWLVLTVAFEFLFGHYVDGKSWAELAANYAIWRGNLWPIVLASLVLAPFVWGRSGRTSELARQSRR
ncbi:MAG TPA: hypothetical protein VFK04_08895 [Gemmatimonadaceae bacterium]|jgi:hypothetical protein|nr:hypothetical protein [Gemmatimonadaceae bacterium]